MPLQARFETKRHKNIGIMKRFITYPSTPFFLQPYSVKTWVLFPNCQSLSQLAKNRPAPSNESIVIGPPFYSLTQNNFPKEMSFI